ncbi:hypothetical protein FRUB_05158 [Fimbriiglobus ruber]|uniref:Uncharacterized protein n=1 Tax=Fimbriiglobus ruber TaxID=1908690 RepID=A0A225DSR0_9BACT|nr:hypothetical protein FRUB_05158 [Fimbriiglobus ruber]
MSITLGSPGDHTRGAGQVPSHRLCQPSEMVGNGKRSSLNVRP